MRKLILNILLAGAVMLPFQSAWAFSLGGPIGFGGDSWQTTELDYGVAGDTFAAPKNLGEEYRHVTPVMYFAYDATFLGFFGFVGSTNVDGAFAILNTVTNVSSYSPALTEFSTDTRDLNYTAQSLGLTDLKSYILGELMTEQMGLTSPERYVWALRERFANPAVNGPKCPDDEEYMVIQRNYDILNTPLNQVQYSPYVNDTLYTFEILETCGKGGALFDATTEPVPVDEFADNLTSVAAFELEPGEFHYGLTRDDVAGLRYLLNSNNINFEATAPSGGILLITNLQAPQTFGPTLPLSLLTSSVLTNDPNTLQTNFPGITFVSVITNIVNLVTTNLSVVFTNQSVNPVLSGPHTNLITGGFYFTNQPGPTVINYDTSTFTTLFTQDLGTFSDLARTNDAATLQLLYPGLQIVKTVATPAIITVTNFVFYLTNQTGSSFGSPPLLVSAPSQIQQLLITNFTYTFGNVFTNHFYTNRTVLTQTIWLTNLTGAAFGSSAVVKTNLASTTIHATAGDFFIIPTNWCGFNVVAAINPNILPPNAFGPTNTILVGIGANGLVTTPVVGGVVAFGVIQNTYDVYTNYEVAIQPGICEPALVIGTTLTTNIVNTYQYVFANVITNSFFTNTFVTVLTTNIGACPGGSPDTLCTNISVNSYYTNVPSGDFYIIPPNFCNFTILSTQLNQVVFITNTITASNATGVVTGDQFTQTIITSFTNSTFKIQASTCTNIAPVPALRQGIEGIRFVRANYDSLLGQFFAPITNTYSMVVVTNSQMTKEYYQRVVTAPDIKLTAQDITSTLPPPTYFSSTRSMPPWDTSTALPNLSGPGTITPGIFIGLNKVGNIFINGSLNVFNLSTNAFLAQNTQTTNSLFAWGSFDATTNPPTVYPNGDSITDVLYLQVSPATAPDGTNGQPYSLTFTVSGGVPNYNIAAPNVSSLVPGLSLPSVTNTNTATLSGTPSAPGVYNFTLQVTDSINRVVNLNYSIIIH